MALQEILNAQKELEQINKSKQKLISEVNALSKEKFGYLEEMPQLIKEAEAQRKTTADTILKTAAVNKDLGLANQQLKDISIKIEEATATLASIQASQEQEAQKLVPLQENVKRRTDEVKAREDAVKIRENAAEALETKSKADSQALDLKISVLEKSQADFNKSNIQLQIDLNDLSDKQQAHIKAVALFEENKVDYFNKQQELFYKLDQATKTLNKNSEIQAQLLAQKAQLDAQIKTLQAKQSERQI